MRTEAAPSTRRTLGPLANVGYWDDIGINWDYVRFLNKGQVGVKGVVEIPVKDRLSCRVVQSSALGCARTAFLFQVP